MAVAIEDLELDLQKSGTPYEVQTDKAEGKIVPCLGAEDCEIQLIVNAFYAPAKARCSEHGHIERGATGGGGGASRETRSEWPVGPAEDLEQLLAGTKEDPRFNAALSVETQTDKSIVKLLPCNGCQRPLAVNQFYAPARAKCSMCGGGRLNRPVSEARIGSLGVVQAGRIDPAKARNLEDALINKTFATHDCPICGADHPMELKHITHNQNYGPSKIIGVDKVTGEPLYKTLPGETVMLQCNWCKCVLGISTSHVMVYRRQNEIKESTRMSTHWEGELGVREEDDDV